MSKRKQIVVDDDKYPSLISFPEDEGIVEDEEDFGTSRTEIGRDDDEGWSEE